MGEKKVMTVDDLKKAYIQLKTDYENLYNGMFKMYQRLTENTNVLMYMFDYRRRIVHANKKIMEVLGVPEKMDFMGKDCSLLKYVEEDSREEFLNMHKAISVNGAREVNGTVRLRHANGMKVVYEHTIYALYDDNGVNTGVCIGQFHDVTERYIKDMKRERFSKIKNENLSFDISYDLKMDKLTVVLPSDLQEAAGGKQKNIYFFSKLVNDEKVCTKADIPIMMDYLKNGTDRSIQIRLFDNYSEEYRWYALSGQAEKNVLKGKIEDITNLKGDEVDNEHLEKVLDCINENFRIIVEINLNEDRYDVLLLDKEDFDDSFEERGTYSELNEILSRNVETGYQQMRREFGSIENIKELLHGKKRIECEYKIANRVRPWRRACVQVMDYDENENPTRAILFHTFTDEDIRRSKVQPDSTENADQGNDIAKNNKEYIGRVLLAEDYAINAEYMIGILEKSDIEVAWAKDGQEAINILKEKAVDYFNFVLLDTRMPNMDGFSAAAQIRNMNEIHGDTIPIIGLSVEDNAENATKAKEAGMNEHLQKPIHAKQVKYLMKKYMSTK